MILVEEVNTPASVIMGRTRRHTISMAALITESFYVPGSMLNTCILSFGQLSSLYIGILVIFRLHIWKLRLREVTLMAKLQVSDRAGIWTKARLTAEPKPFLSTLCHLPGARKRADIRVLRSLESPALLRWVGLTRPARWRRRCWGRWRILSWPLWSHHSGHHFQFWQQPRGPRKRSVRRSS